MYFVFGYGWNKEIYCVLLGVSVYRGVRECGIVKEGYVEFV